MMNEPLDEQMGDATTSLLLLLPWALGVCVPVKWARGLVGRGHTTEGTCLSIA